MISFYRLFQAKLYPVLPLLLHQALKVRKLNPLPPAVSEHLVLGNGQRKILILGESTAAGVGASEVKFTLAGHLSSHFGPSFQVTNLGKNGLKVAQVQAHFQEPLAAVPTPLEGIFLFLGANDCFRLTHPREFRLGLEHLITDLNSSFSPAWIYVADIPPVHHFPAFPPLLRSFLQSQRSFLRKEILSICAADGRLIFDPLEFSFHPEFFASDGIHPSDEGYSQIASFAFSGLRVRNLL